MSMPDLGEVPHPHSLELREMTEAEKFVVRSLRKWLLGHWDESHHVWRCMLRECRASFGDKDGPKIVISISKIVSTLVKYGNRKIRFHKPCCPCLDTDEYCLVRFITACQNNNGALARALASWLLVDDGIGDFLTAGLQLGTNMKKHALQLPEIALGQTHADNFKSYSLH
ncbi:MAG: hypothetical protein CMM28_13815 [Rhodospirillaceae bacterium]|nr:hypothetical protein [Rhodospirillaceae bacterium]|tara:strand:- start:139 stop:648 length:510 start_codon:yes stop_codon:yes gene_type:complete